MRKIQSLFASTHYQKLEEKYLCQLFSEHLQGRSVLDIGCGEGRYLRLLQNSCSKMTGVDFNMVQVNALRQEGFNTFTPDELPIQNKYDVLLMSHVIEHLDPEKLVQFMDHYLSMLAENGILIILTPMPGVRFWHDYTHVRPYTPQSLGMMFGILNGPVAFRPKNKMLLKRIYFFRDSWRIRDSRYYYPIKIFSKPNLKEKTGKYFIFLMNTTLASLHAISGGRFGTTASWIGIYQKTNSINN